LKSLLLTLLLCLCLAVPGTALGNDVNDALQKGRTGGYRSLSLEEYYVLGNHFRDNNKPYCAALFYKLGMEKLFIKALRQANTRYDGSLPAGEYARYIEQMAYFCKPFLRTVVEISAGEGIWYGSDPIRRHDHLEDEGLYSWMDDDYERGQKVRYLCKEVYEYQATMKALIRLGMDIPLNDVLELLYDDDFIINLVTVGTVGRVQPHWNMVHEPKDNFCGFARRKFYNQLFSYSQQWAAKSYETTKDKKIHGLERLQQLMRKADRENLPYDKAEAEKDLAKMRDYIETL